MIAFFVKHRATVVLVTVCILIFGFLSYQALPREAAPDIEIPVVMVTTPYIGVAPEDVESLVTVPLENELAGIKDLKKMTSSSTEGVSVITLEFEPEVIIEDALQRVRDRVSNAEAKLPKDAESTSIHQISISDMPILIITIGGPVDEEELKKIGERLDDEVRQVDGVLDTKLTGGRTREIRVQLDPHRLQHYSLQMNDVIGAIATENINMPGGDVRTGDSSYLLRVPGELTSIVEIEGVAVKRVGDRPVFVRDIGTVVDGFADRESYSRMNRQPAVALAVTKRPGANMLAVAEQVKAVTAKHQEGWPKEVVYQALGDQSRQVKERVGELEANIVTALILVMMVIVLFMGGRNSLFVAISIPLSMLLGIIVIWALGMTLNITVLFALILVLGMLVDDAIVVVENIYRHLEDGCSPVEASIKGTGEVAAAVIGSSLTTIAAFLPLLFWTGTVGQFMSILPKVVITILLASLVVAVGILPVFTSKLMKAKLKHAIAPRGAADAAPLDKDQPPPAQPERLVMRAYRAVLKWSIRRRYISALLVTGTLVGTVIVYAGNHHGTQFLPEVEPDQAVIAVRTPDGTSLDATDAIVRQIEAILAEEANINVFVSETGVSGGGVSLVEQSARNVARITVDFWPHWTKVAPGERTRVEDTRVTIDRLRRKINEIPGAVFVVDEPQTGPPVGAPIAVEISGDDFHECGKLALQLKRDLAKIEGVTDISDNYKVGRPEMQLRIDRGAAKRVGASTQAVAGTVRTAVAGTKASTLRDGDDEHDIMVELAPRYKDDLQAIMALRLPGRIPTSPDTFPVPISAVASFKLAGGSGAIQHIDRDLVVTVQADVADGYNQNAVREKVKAHLETMKKPAGYHLRLGGADDEQRRTMAFLGVAFLVSIFLVAVVLVAQFSSFSTPLIIIGTVVLSIIGVLWGLLITKTPFGVVLTGLGVISLGGVVVNNAIVLLDYAEQLQQQGLSMHDALVKAGVVRFRPVMLTAGTTILGLVPMALGMSVDFGVPRLLIGGQGADFWGPMANAVIFGLGFATLLTLIMVPTFYSILADLKAAPGKVVALVRRMKRPPKKMAAARADSS